MLNQQTPQATSLHQLFHIYKHSPNKFKSTIKAHNNKIAIIPNHKSQLTNTSAKKIQSKSHHISHYQNNNDQNLMTFKAIEYSKKKEKHISFSQIANQYLQKSCYPSNHLDINKEIHQEYYSFPTRPKIKSKPLKNLDQINEQISKLTVPHNLGNNLSKIQYNQICQYLDDIKLNILQKITYKRNVQTYYKSKQICNKLKQALDSVFSTKLQINQNKLYSKQTQVVNNHFQKQNKKNCLFSFQDLLSKDSQFTNKSEENKQAKIQKYQQIISISKHNNSINSSIGITQILQSIKQCIQSINQPNERSQNSDICNNYRQNIQKSVNSFLQEDKTKDCQQKLDENLKQNINQIYSIDQPRQNNGIINIQYNIKHLKQKNKNNQVIRISPLKFLRKQQVVSQLLNYHIITKQSSSIVF